MMMIMIMMMIIIIIIIIIIMKATESAPQVISTDIFPVKRL
jgi:hypothetical protein